MQNNQRKIEKSRRRYRWAVEEYEIIEFEKIACLNKDG